MFMETPSSLKQGMRMSQRSRWDASPWDDMVAHARRDDKQYHLSLRPDPARSVLYERPHCYLHAIIALRTELTRNLCKTTCSALAGINGLLSPTRSELAMRSLASWERSNMRLANFATLGLMPRRQGPCRNLCKWEMREMREIYLSCGIYPRPHNTHSSLAQGAERARI